MFKKVLVPLDGTELAEGILPYVSQLARGLGIPLVLLSVVGPHVIGHREPWSPLKSDVPTDLWDLYSPGLRSYQLRPLAPSPERIPEFREPHISELMEKARTVVERKHAEVIDRLEREGLKAKSVVSFGPAAEEIIRMAQHEECDLIAMSTHGRSELGRSMLGSVTDKVIHTSHLPTLTITPERAKEYWQPDEKITRILVPLDGSELAETALPYVRHLAGELSLEVLLARVARLGDEWWGYMGGYAYTGSADVDAILKAEATKYLKGVVDRLNKDGLKVNYKLLWGNVAHQLIELARETPHDIIAVTTHGRSGLSRWVLGSITEKLVRASGDPVLVIPPGQP